MLRFFILFSVFSACAMTPPNSPGPLHDFVRKTADEFNFPESCNAINIQTIPKYQSYYYSIKNNLIGVPLNDSDCLMHSTQKEFKKFPRMQQLQLSERQKLYHKETQRIKHKYNLTDREAKAFADGAGFSASGPGLVSKGILIHEFTHASKNHALTSVLTVLATGFASCAHVQRTRHPRIKKIAPIYVLVNQYVAWCASMYWNEYRADSAIIKRAHNNPHLLKSMGYYYDACQKIAAQKEKPLTISAARINDFLNPDPHQTDKQRADRFHEATHQSKQRKIANR